MFLVRLVGGAIYAHRISSVEAIVPSGLSLDPAKPLRIVDRKPRAWPFKNITDRGAAAIDYTKAGAVRRAREVLGANQ